MLPGGVMVTRLTLDQLFQVRILARQPILCALPDLTQTAW